MFASRAFSEPFERKPAPVLTAICPKCGGPAEEETFWSVSAERPGFKVLKRKITCGKPPTRGFRQRRSVATCCVDIQELAVEPITPPTPIRSNLDMNERSIEEAPRRGRLPAEVRSQILELHQQGTSVEEIAERLNRSVATVRRVVGDDGLPDEVGGNEIDKVGGSEIDGVIEFLAGLPEEAIEEVLQLARLQREQRLLRSSLEMRLKDLKKSP